MVAANVGKTTDDVVQVSGDQLVEGDIQYGTINYSSQSINHGRLYCGKICLSGNSYYDIN